MEKGRISQCLEILARYGGAAKPLLPQLFQLEMDLLAHTEAKKLQAHIDELKSLIKSIESDTTAVELRNLK